MLNKSPVGAILPAMDMMRAKQFYQQKLRLELVSEDPQGITFKSGECTQLFVYPRPEPTKAEHTVAGWTVDDVESTVRDLRSRGVVFEHYDMPGLKTNAEGIATMGLAKAAWFKDTEGNILAITTTP
jgi:predicted enzyme related to lactoylglutathione lyase